MCNAPSAGLWRDRGTPSPCLFAGGSGHICSSLALGPHGQMGPAVYLNVLCMVGVSNRRYLATHSAADIFDTKPLRHDRSSYTVNLVICRGIYLSMKDDIYRNQMKKLMKKKINERSMAKLSSYCLHQGYRFGFCSIVSKHFDLR